MERCAPIGVRIRTLWSAITHVCASASNGAPFPPARRGQDHLLQYRANTRLGPSVNHSSWSVLSTGTMRARSHRPSLRPSAPPSAGWRWPPIAHAMNRKWNGQRSLSLKNNHPILNRLHYIHSDGRGGTKNGTVSRFDHAPRVWRYRPGILRRARSATAVELSVVRRRPSGLW